MLRVYVFSYQDGWPPHSWAMVPRSLEAEPGGSELLELLTSWSPISPFSLPFTTVTRRAYQHHIQLIPLSWGNSIHGVKAFSSALSLPNSLTVKKKGFRHGRTIGYRAQVDIRTGLHIFSCLKRLFWKGMPEEVTPERSWHFVHLDLGRCAPPDAKQREKHQLGEHGCYEGWLTFALKTKSVMGHWVWSGSIINPHTTPWKIRDEWAGDINACDRKCRARVACKMGGTQHSVITWSQPGTRLSLESQHFLELK